MFQKMSEHGHYGNRDNTKQGIYVCTPSGEFLASINSNDPDRVMGMMNEGLKAWHALNPDQKTNVDASINEPHRRTEAAEPKDGLILAVFTRDLPDSLDPKSPVGEKWNRDTAWFSKPEALSLIPKKASVGQTLKFPEPLVERLVGLHLVDAVNGQTSHFERESVSDSEITAMITKVTDDTIFLELQGKTTCASTKRTRDSSPRGVVTRLFGNAVFDSKKETFTQFEVVALGRRWGYTQFNFRKQEKRNSGPIGFVLQLAPQDEPPNVPAFFWGYRVGWMNQ